MRESEISQPLRENLRENILRLIARMDFSLSTRLPSENQLAAKFKVSRSTVRTVLSDLETEGKVLRKQGSGTYVNTQAFLLETTLYPRIGMREIIQKNGYFASSRNLFVREVPAGTAAGFLGCPPDEIIQESHSLYLADDRPCMYCIDKMRKGLFSEQQWKSDKFQEQSLYMLFREITGTPLCWDIMRIRSVNCDAVPEVAEYLIKEGENRSLILLEIRNYDEGSRPILHGSIYVNADLIQLNLIRDIMKL